MNALMASAWCTGGVHPNGKNQTIAPAATATPTRDSEAMSREGASGSVIVAPHRRRRPTERQAPAAVARRERAEQRRRGWGPAAIGKRRDAWRLDDRPRLGKNPPMPEPRPRKSRRVSETIARRIKKQI